jgi:hypothetical protein
LPQEVNAIPDEYRFSQAFGWGPSVGGAATLFLAGLIFWGQSHGPRVDHRIETAGFAAVSAILFCYEILRRRHATVLVPVDTGATGRQVALYLKSNFDSTVPPNQVTC